MSRFERLQKEDQSAIKLNIENFLAEILTSSSLSPSEKDEFKSNLTKTLVSRPVLEVHEIALDDDEDVKEIFNFLKTIKQEDIKAKVIALESKTNDTLKNYPKTRETLPSIFESTWGTTTRTFKNAYRNPWTRGLAEKAITSAIESEMQKQNVQIEIPTIEVKSNQPAKDQTEDLDDDAQFFDAQEGPAIPNIIKDDILKVTAAFNEAGMVYHPEDLDDDAQFFDAQEGPAIPKIKDDILKVTAAFNKEQPILQQPQSQQAEAVRPSNQSAKFSFKAIIENVYKYFKNVFSKFTSKIVVRPSLDNDFNGEVIRKLSEQKTHTPTTHNAIRSPTIFFPTPNSNKRSTPRR